MYTGVPGSESVAGGRKCMCRNLGEPKCSKEAAEGAENAMKLYVTLVVGPTHSRGVNRVMSVEGNEAHSKGLAV